MGISSEKRKLFERLYQEFLSSYAVTKHGQWYGDARRTAKAGYDQILQAKGRGEDVTELALKRLLPHNDSAFNRERGAWVTFAPAVTKEIKAWFEAAPHIKADPKAWPTVAADLLGLVQRCVEHPAELPTACAAFAAKAHSRGFQAGMLSPILNALAPAQFALVNNKSRAVASFFLDEKLSSSLEDYAATNTAMHALVESLSPILGHEGVPAIAPGDRFDMFCHWLVAEKKYPLKAVGYWKIAPGEGASHWEECREGGFIAIGWDELGDLTGVDRAEFNRRRDACIKKYGWKKGGVDQVWRFLTRVREGDRVVANKGWSEVVGIGTVTGDYYYEAGAQLAHRIPVEWDDTRRRKISRHGWSMTLCSLDQADFNEVATAPVVEEPSASGSSLPPGTLPPPTSPLQPPYPVETLAAETYQELAEVERWVRAVKRKGQAVFFGPPGTGKTFCAERLARHLVAGGNGTIHMVQFHPSYGYEDFIEGIRPRATEGGALSYPVVPGRFLEVCAAAAKTADPTVLIVDEINRANLSRVFGELMYLLEYRLKDVPLASGTRLQVPANLFLIGTMNTADRSIALIDHALRRRFAFIRLPPKTEALGDFHEKKESGFDPAGLIAVLGKLNKAIDDPNYEVGVSYFMREDIAEQIADVWQMEIEPYLEELFFDRPTAHIDAFRWTKVAEEILPE